MFKKSNPPPPKNALAERVRQLSEPKQTARGPTETTAPGTKARTARQPVYKNGALTLGDGQKLKVVIKNLSAAGAYVEFFIKTDLRGDVVLTEPTLPLKRWARVIWQRDGAAGLKFIER